MANKETDYSISGTTVRLLVATTLALAILPEVASSAAIKCTGTVDRLMFHVPGGIYTSIGGSPNVKICDPQIQFNRVTPENCKFISTLLTSAKVSERQVTAVFDSESVTSCDALPNWSDQDLRAIDLE